VRPTDEELADALIRKDALITIQGGRQMGKTSLIARSLEYARASGATTAFTDLQRMNQSDLENIERFYVALGNMLADQLGIDADIEDKWRPTRSPNVNFENFISREVMPRANGHLFWAIDEADRVAATDFASDFFGMIRSWHSCRVVNPDSPLANLTTITAYTVESHRLITDQQQSGFNVGTRLVLHDFKIEEVEALNKLYGSPLRSGEEISRYFNLLAGQPYLVQRGLFELSAGGSSFEEFALNADCDEGPFGDHLGRMLWMMRQDPEMTEATRILLDGGSNISIKGFQGLRAAGIVVGPSSFDSRFHCALYAGYLRKHLGEQTG
jgi:hypothetical protein